MALFGLFGKKSEGSHLRKLAERAGNKRAQAVDRWEAIQTLSRMANAEAAQALIPRFTFYVDPSITDQEEKDLAFDGIVGAGDAALPAVLQFLRRSDSISWPLKMLDKLASEEAVVGHLIEVLSEMDVEYERDPQRKIQILGTLEERRDPRIGEAVARFLEDANETVRFNSVGALLAQEEVADAHRDALLSCFCDEESVRIRNRILDGCIARSWGLGERLDDVKKRLPPGYKVDKGGLPRKA